MSGLFDVVKKAYLALRRRPKAAQTRTNQLEESRTTQLEPTNKLVPIQTMRAHTNVVSAIAFFKDGRQIVTASRDKTLRICNVNEGVLVGEPFAEHSDAVTSVAVSPDDRRIASGGRDGVIVIWDVD
ncbi:WD40 repeat-like protein, partial [Suillus decipiens]